MLSGRYCLGGCFSKYESQVGEGRVCTGFTLLSWDWAGEVSQIVQSTTLQVQSVHMILMLSCFTEKVYVALKHYPNYYPNWKGKDHKQECASI